MEREEKRLEQFRQLRKEIRGSQEYLVVGVDISKDTHNALMRTVSGKTLYRRLTFNNTREGFENLLLQVEAVRVQHGLKEAVFSTIRSTTSVRLCLFDNCVGGLGEAGCRAVPSGFAGRCPLTAHPPNA